MQLTEQSYEIMNMDDATRVEFAGRICYKSEERITEDSAGEFARGLIKSGHLAMVEHAHATVKFITNRGVTHELVRHRMASFGQESTRYVKYLGKMEFIRPVWLTSSRSPALSAFIGSCIEAEKSYKELIDCGWEPEQAREVLPNALKTEIVVTANFREWRHIFQLRALGTTGRPHPQIQALMLPVLKEFAERLPMVFGDLTEHPKYAKAVQKFETV